ncbi:MAG TPA: hypothetical protein VFW03_23360 [Gemmatimonadaceae bacterium]|nr:hypothetical protein [Gemmatimonadaceae bacterium]
MPCRTDDLIAARWLELSASRVVDLRASRRVELAARFVAGLRVGSSAGGDDTDGRAAPEVATGSGARVIARLEGEVFAAADDAADALASEGTDQSVVANTSAMTIPDTRPDAKAIGLPDR